MRARVGEPIIKGQRASLPQRKPVAPTAPAAPISAHSVPARRPRSLEGFVRRVATPKSSEPRAIRPVAHRPQAVRSIPRRPIARSEPKAVASTPQPTVQAPQPQTVAPPRSKRSRFLTRFQMPLILMGAIFLGTLAQTLMVGQVLLAIYAVFAIWKGMASALSFKLGLIGMVATAMAFVLQNGQLANTFAIYTFWLFAIGLVTLFIEIWRESWLDKRAIKAARKLAKAKS
ncbi:MAG TPA: hypothetical protein VLF60_00625 [Candidatus Saccharimonadales bacterium]|nr:hypothetical protein [Candidatus Saccharimonadales bacterium]